jgi:glutathione S-transferase
MYTLTTFRSVPPFVVGYVRDVRVRWALEEAQLAYKVRLIGPDDRPTPAYRQQQPFGQVPVLEHDGTTLFETGAILLHLGERSPALLPLDHAGREQAVVWMFAALNSVEPHIANLSEMIAFHAGEAWTVERRPALEQMAVKRLGDLDAWLDGRDYLTGRFTVADIMMTTVLRLLDSTGLVERFPNLHAYKARCMARPAWKKALADQVAQYAPAAVPA